MALRGWGRTVAMVCSPAYAALTLKTLALWLRTSLNSPARETLKTLFNERYYLSLYSDVEKTGVHPYLHYLFRGYLEGRNPSEQLNTAHYVATYADVRQARINPALHYALFGKAEHRSAIPVRTTVTPQAAAPLALINNAWLPGRPLVSVVIPCFNYGAFVEEALQSVLAQTFRNYEVILVEGGSTDGVTPGILAGIEARGYENVRVLYRPVRCLVGDNRNFGISHALGRYICCLDADDLLKPIYLEIAVFLAEAYGYDIVSASLQCFGESEVKWMLEDASFPAISEYNQIATSALFRKSAWAEIGGYRDWGLGEQHIPEDWEFWVRLLAHGYRCKSIRELLMFYRVHGAGLTGTCETDLQHQKDQIRQANQDLLNDPVIAPR
ncbi:MAG: glycosyltransferase, partial [Acidobacteriota bacterium]|nr:glycosyltransferase [Acidobacteriota bacterium]